MRVSESGFLAKHPAGGCCKVSAGAISCGVSCSSPHRSHQLCSRCDTLCRVEERKSIGVTWRARKGVESVRCCGPSGEASSAAKAEAVAAKDEEPKALKKKKKKA